MRPREINVHIEELVLHGFPPGGRHLIGAALESKLSTLLVEQGVPPSWHASPERLDAGTVRANPRTQSATAGEQIARAIHGGPIP